MQPLSLPVNTATKSFKDPCFIGSTGSGSRTDPCFIGSTGSGSRSVSYFLKDPALDNFQTNYWVLSRVVLLEHKYPPPYF